MPLDHPESCGCAVCRRHRERLDADPTYREVEAGRSAHDRYAPEPSTWHDPEPAKPEPEVRVVREVVHEHHHHHEHTEEVREPRERPRRVSRAVVGAVPGGPWGAVVAARGGRRPRRPRRHSRPVNVLRFVVVGAVLVWLLHSFYPQLSVPVVPGVSCASGSAATTAGGVEPAGIGIPPSPQLPPFLLGPKLGDLAKQSVGSAVKTAFVFVSASALHAAGETARAMADHAPSVADVRAGLIRDSRAVGHVAGFAFAALGGKPVGKLTHQESEVAPSGVVAPACGVCPGQVTPAAVGTDGVDTAARAAWRAGWTGQDAVTAVAIAGAESGWRHDAANGHSTARGMWQTMMSYHAAKYRGASWADPYANARVAHQIWANAHGWSPWVAYTSGAYRSHLAEARAAVARLQGGSTVSAAYTTPTADPPVLVDGKKVSTVAARQLRLAERLSGIDLRVMQGGYGGSHILASGTSHNYPGVVDVAPGTTAVEKVLRRVGFAAWARNIPLRSQVGSGAHVHAVSLLETCDRKSPQVYGSWAHYGNGLSGAGNDPAPHYAWVPNLRARIASGVVPAASTACAPGSGSGGGGVVSASSVASSTGGQAFGIASFNVLGASHTAAGGKDPSWPSGVQRMPGALRLIAAHQVDVVGFQEMQHSQAQAFDRLAGGTFARWPPRGDTDNSIAWRRGTFRLLSASTLGVPYFDGHERRMPVVRLEYRPTGEAMAFVNVHNPADTSQYPRQGHWRSVAVSREIRALHHLAAEGPVFLTGDLNDRSQVFCRLTANGDLTAAAGGSHAGRCRPPDYGGIDWIYGRTGTHFMRHTVAHATSRTSDHPMVTASVSVGSRTVMGGP